MKVAVIGAGTRGRALARACATAGFEVVLEDVMPDKLRRALDEFEVLGAPVEIAGTVEDAVREADVVIDFVPDDLESKLEIWSLIDRMAPPKTVMCTPSDGLSITDLASCTYRSDRCVMVRGEMEPGKAVRLLASSKTSDQALELLTTLFARLGCNVEVQPDPDLPMLLKNMKAAAL